jgi:hypothetical protein
MIRAFGGALPNADVVQNRYRLRVMAVTTARRAVARRPSVMRAIEYGCYTAPLEIGRRPIQPPMLL